MIIENKNLDNLYNKYYDLRKNIKALEKKDVIQKYNTYKIQKEEILTSIENLVRNIQENCNHKIWYFLSSSTDDYEGRTYYTCKCLDCDYIEEARSKYFINIIRTKMKFSEVQKEYKKNKIYYSKYRYNYGIIKREI